MTIAAESKAIALPEVEAVLLKHQVEEFLSRYQSAIDEQRYLDWLELFVPEGVYSVIDHENSQAHGMYLIYDDGLEARKERVAYLMGYWKVPRSKALHTVSNVLIASTQDDALEARSKFTVYRTDREGVTAFHTGGEYQDEFERSESGLLLRRHEVVIDMNVLPDDFTDLL
jgi:3-phenylpropionate/cinnamic acid dioxygenase small subunit